MKVDEFLQNTMKEIEEQHLPLINNYYKSNIILKLMKNGKIILTLEYNKKPINKG